VKAAAWSSKPKRQTGIETDTDLIEFLRWRRFALEDKLSRRIFRGVSRPRVDPELEASVSEVAEIRFRRRRGRWARFESTKRPLARRGDEELPFVKGETWFGGQGLLVDTCVYIDQLQDRSPAGVGRPDSATTSQPFDRRDPGRLMHTVGVLNPSDARTAGLSLPRSGKQIKANAVASDLCCRI